MKQKKQQKLLKYSLEGEPVGQVPGNGQGYTPPNSSVQYHQCVAARTALLMQCFMLHYNNIKMEDRGNGRGCVVCTKAAQDGLNFLHFPYTITNLRVNCNRQLCNKNWHVTTRPAAQITSNVLE
jgi:hypothetical protein